MWNPNKTQILDARKHLLFFGGTIGEPTVADYTGRGGVYARYKSNPDFQIINTAEPGAPRVDFSQAMQVVTPYKDSEFCYSPRGSNGGDTDRYMAGLMFGCIPVFLSHSAAGQQMALPFDEVIPWSRFSTSVAWKDLDSLESHLRTLLPHAAQMRRNMKPYVHQLLYTSKYGSYFGESSGDDTMHTLIRVLRQRITHTRKARSH